MFLSRHPDTRRTFSRAYHWPNGFYRHTNSASLRANPRISRVAASGRGFAHCRVADLVIKVPFFRWSANLLEDGDFHAVKVNRLADPGRRVGLGIGDRDI